MSVSLPSLAGLSPSARAFLSLCARSRVEERPGRHKAAQTRRPKVQPIIPIAKAQGVSRSDIVERCRWWGESRWTLEVVTPVVEELVARGVLARCVNGIRFTDAWGPLVAEMLGVDHERVNGALERATETYELGLRESAGMLHMRAVSLAIDWTPSDACTRVGLVQELDDLVAVLAGMRAAVVAGAS